MKPLIIKKSTFPKKNYQQKDSFIGGMRYNEQGKILIEVKRETEKPLSFHCLMTEIHNITASSFESAISQMKRIARKQHKSNSIWNNQNIPIIIYGIELKEHPNWLLKIKTNEN